MNLFRFWNFAREFRRTKERAKAIKNDEEKRYKSKRFGIASILSSVICVAFTVPVVFGVKWITSDDMGIILTIGSAIVALIGLFGILAALYKAIESWAFQLYINKRPITWISLAVWIAAIIAIPVILVLIL